MLRNRLIFALIYNDGVFTQSRNFRLQNVGDVNWLEKNYKIQDLSFSIDELIIIDATKDKKNITTFTNVVKQIASKVFIPVAAGGGIRCVEDAELLFRSGADKIILNSALYENPKLIKDLSEKYGGQSIIGSIDYRKINKELKVFIKDGTTEIDSNLNEYLLDIGSIGVGEVILNSINQDGTGFGFDIETADFYAKKNSLPIILMGGAGNSQHLKVGLSIEGVSAVATANLFNFIGDGLPNARTELINEGCNLAKW
tara:strand:- start:823 stop:1590 length:768 start_codon:yes stop_codon:yes gene_type:complete